MLPGYPGLHGNLLKSTVAPIMVELVRTFFVANIQVEEAVVVVVGPGRTIGVDRIHQAGLAGDVGEGAVAIVPEQTGPDGIGEPGPAGNKDVQVAVVIIICL